MNEFSSIFRGESDEEEDVSLGGSRIDSSRFQNEFTDVFRGGGNAPIDDITQTVFDMSENRQERGLGQNHDRVASAIYDDFLTNPRTGRQDISDRGAITELNRNMELFRSIGIDDEFDRLVEAENDSFGADNVIEPIFDFLSIGNYPIAGGIEELMLTGSPQAALKQAGIEFLNSVGIADNLGLQDQVRRTNYGDILTGRRGDTPLAIGKEHPYTAAVAGFVFDVLLDPTTYFGFGLAKVGKAAGSLTAVQRIKSTVAGSPMGMSWRKQFMPNSVLKGLKEGENADELAAVINDLNEGVEGYVAIVGKDVREGAGDFLAQQVRKDASTANQLEVLRENVIKYAGEMNEGELRLVGAFLDNPKLVEGLVGELKVDANTKAQMMEGVSEWKGMFDEMFEAEKAEGLFDKSQMRSNYSAGMEPVTEHSRKIVQKMFELRFGKVVGRKAHEKATGDGIATITENGIMKSSMTKQYPTLESRLIDLVMTETNVALMATKRGIESIRKINTQKFYDGILSDPRIAVPIDQVVAMDSRHATHEALRQSGMRIFQSPALSTKKAKGQLAGDEQMYYALPSAMVDNLEDMNKIMSGGDDLNIVSKTFKEVQGLWKAYALMSPGYHMRNLYSNVFNNYLAGVSSPKAYAEAMLLQIEDTANIGNRAVRKSVEGLLGGRKAIDGDNAYMFNLADGRKMKAREILDEAEGLGVTGGGMIFNESDLGVGRELMSSLERRNVRASTTEISEGLNGWGDRAQRVNGIKSTILKASREAGSNITEDVALRQAELTDGIARAWAWENWKTPEEFYEDRINTIRAYTTPAAGPPEAGLDFLHQNAGYRPVGPNVGTPEWNKAAKGMAAVREDGSPIVMYHGSKYMGAIAKEKGFNLANDGGENIYASGIYMTEDLIGVNPLMNADITTGYAIGQKGLEIVKKMRKVNRDMDKTTTLKGKSREQIDARVSAIDKEIESLTAKLGSYDGRWSGLVPKKISGPTAALFEKRNQLALERNNYQSYANLSDESDDYLTRYSVLNGLNLDIPDIEPGIVDMYNFMKAPFVIGTRNRNGTAAIWRAVDEDEITEVGDAVVSELFENIRVYGDQFGFLPKDSVSDLKKDIEATVFGRLGPMIDDLEFVDDPKLYETQFHSVTQYETSADHLYQEVSHAVWEVLDGRGIFSSDVDGTLEKAMEVTNNALKRMGYDGITHPGGVKTRGDKIHQTWIAWDEGLVKSVRNRGSWDLSTRDLMAQQGDEGLQGAVQFLDNKKADILLSANADPTTFIHEMAHVIRRTMLEEGDKTTIQKWMLGEKDYTRLKKEAMSQAEETARMAPNAEIDVERLSVELMDRFSWTVEGEEMFARGFEQFLTKGVVDKNQGAAMQDTFDFMRTQFRNVYDQAGEGMAGIAPNEEVEKVLERVLGRGAEPEPETLGIAKAILESPQYVSENIFQKARRKIGNNWATEKNRLWGKNMEDNSRLAHFITMRTQDTGLMKSNGLLNKKATGEVMTAEDAAVSVKRFLFDYGELTPFERDRMKTIIPFYTWMRKNIPLQMQQLYENPERYSKIPKVLNEIESMSPQWEGVQEPDYFTDIHATRLPFDSGSIPLDGDGLPTYLSLDLPFGDLNRLNMKDMISSMSPFLKVWAEIYPKKGYSFFLDTGIESYADEPFTMKFGGEEYDVGFNEKTAHVLKTFIPHFGKGARALERAGEGKLGEQLLREILGINIRSQDPDAVHRADLYKRREVSRALKARLIKKAKLMGLEDAIDDL